MNLKQTVTSVFGKKSGYKKTPFRGIKKINLIVAFFLQLIVLSGFSQKNEDAAPKKKSKITISGYVYDANTGEVLIGCSVYDKKSYIGTTTNTFGFYSFSLPNDGTEKSITFSFISFEKQEVLVSTDKKINIKLSQGENKLNAVVISVSKDEKKQVLSSDMGKIALKSTEINALPAVGGETDVLKAITLLPGIKQGVDGSSGFYVRGGGPDQNLILLDGVPMYNPYHLWGFLSTFNSDAINNIEVTKGAFPARYGGRLSSVLDITMKEGNNQKWQRDVTIGLLSAKALVSGPIVKDKSAVMVSARRTYADLILVPILSAQNSGEDLESKEGYNFSDLNLKLNYKLSDKHRLYFSGFYSRDKYYLRQEGNGVFAETKFTDEVKRNQGWSNLIGSVRWNYLLGDKFFVNTTAYYSSYDYYTDNSTKRDSENTDIVNAKETSSEYLSDIVDVSIKQDYQYFPSNNHHIRFGFSGIYHSFKPGVNSFFSQTGSNVLSNETENNDINATEFSIYAEDDIDIAKRIRINIGCHTSGFSVQGENYLSIQPRFSSRFSVNENISLKAGYAKMTQYLHLLSSSGIVQSSDLWVPATKNVQPQLSDQVSIGTAITLRKKYSLEIEGYYKTMENLIDYKDGASFLDTKINWEDKIASGKGLSYGGEVFLKKNKGKLTGWIGYTLSWSNRQIDEINFGETYPYRYDRRHDFSLVSNYKFNKKWSLNTSWVFYTGNAVTLPTTSYITPNYNGNFQNSYSFPTPGAITGGGAPSSGIIDNSLGRNNYRLPAYHRLDVTATYSKKTDWGKWELTFGIINLYNRFNASSYYISDEQNTETGEAEVKYTQRTLFPFMPTINYRISF